MADIRVKICGLSDRIGVEAAVNAGAAYIGFVFFPKSPRNVSHAQAAELALLAPPGVAKVALTVNATDAELDALTAAVPLDMIQLHGAEGPDRVAAVRHRYGLPVMKAVGIAGLDDLTKIDSFAAVADQLLIDAKPPKDSVLPGGNGVAFDWDLLAGRQWDVPWMLAGGLTPNTVADALRQTGARQLDLSSGVERAPGVKDPTLIQQFFEAVAAA